MSTASVQKKKVLEEFSRIFFASGVKPRLIDVLNNVSEFFAKNPIGQPLTFSLEELAGGVRSDPDLVNDIFAKFSFNLDVLYDTCEEQVDQVMTLTTVLRNELQRLKARREQLMAKIDDKLFSLYNTDGYYYSISDSFNTLSLIDANLSSAFVDITSGNVTIPTLSSLSKRMSLQDVDSFSVDTFLDKKPCQHRTMAESSGAFDGLTNTYWGIEVTSDTPQEAVAVIHLSVGGQVGFLTMSRIDYDPYGVVPVQCFVEVANSLAVEGASQFRDFGSSIQTSPYNMSFVDNAAEINRITITLRKTEPDYTVQVNGQTKYRYIFGAKNITVTEQVYDNEASLVTEVLGIEEDLDSEYVIDAVSLVADARVPAGTNVHYYVAADIGNPAATMDEYTWKKISPLSATGSSPDTIVHFDGALAFSKMIRLHPNASEIQQIPLDYTNKDLQKRNPSAVIIPGVDVYRLAKFEEEDLLAKSVVLEEGINSTRIHYTTLNEDGLSLSYWADYINGTEASSTVYGRIDTGNEFFYGADVGEAGVSCLVEAFLECDQEHPLLLKEVSKIDPNSKTWDIKVFLNGREVAYMPVGTNKTIVPWKFQEGINHIILLANIPAGTTAYPNSYVGAIDLMGEDDLFDFGTVKLATWKYVDLFKMQYNEVDQPYTFTIHNGEIISRRKPTTNFRVKYAKSTSKAPSGVRVRFDMQRDSSNPHLTPILDGYRLRFLYGNL